MSLAPLRSDPLKFASVKSVPLRFEPWRLAAWKLAWRKLRPLKFARLRSFQFRHAARMAAPRMCDWRTFRSSIIFDALIRIALRRTRDSLLVESPRRSALLRSGQIIDLVERQRFHAGTPRLSTARWSGSAMEDSIPNRAVKGRKRWSESAMHYTIPERARTGRKHDGCSFY